jgi:hypothetical protein
MMLHRARQLASITSPSSIAIPHQRAADLPCGFALRQTPKVLLRGLDQVAVTLIPTQ